MVVVHRVIPFEVNIFRDGSDIGLLGCQVVDIDEHGGNNLGCIVK